MRLQHNLRQGDGLFVHVPGILCRTSRLRTKRAGCLQVLARGAVLIGAACRHGRKMDAPPRLPSPICWNLATTSYQQCMNKPICLLSLSLLCLLCLMTHTFLKFEEQHSRPSLSDGPSTSSHSLCCRARCTSNSPLCRAIACFCAHCRSWDSPKHAHSISAQLLLLLRLPLGDMINL